MDKDENAAKLATKFGVRKESISNWQKNCVKIGQFCTKICCLWFAQNKDKEPPLTNENIKKT